mgnify:FL=1
MTIGERIRARRKELKLTLKDVNELTSISTGNLSEIENGKYLPGVLALLQLSNALKCSTDWIMKGDTEPCYQETEDDCMTQLDPIETDVIQMYRTFDERDKKETYDMLQIKFSRYKR